jgi:hypothetical protein
MTAGSGGILDDAMFAGADFTAANYRTLSFQFELLEDDASATGVGAVRLVESGTELSVQLMADGLSGEVIAAHLHEAPAGQTGPVVRDLGGLIVENAGGTAIYSVSGHVNKPGNYELPMGIPFRELLDICGGVRDGRKLKAVIPGGSSVPVMPADQIIDLTMDYDSLQKAGSALGTGAVIVMDDSTCMVKVLERISRFYYAESCGQCTPCREGTGWMYRVIKRIREGQGTEGDLEKLMSVANKIEGHTICALGDAAAWPVQSFLRQFGHEFEYMVEHGHSIVDAPDAKVA